MPELRLPRRTETVSVLCERAEALARDAGWTEADVIRVGLAIGEAVGNAVEHGEGDVRVRFEADAAAFEAVVADGGDGPPPERIERPLLPEDPLATSGRGLFILQHLADDVTVDAEGALWLTIRPRS